MTDIEPSKDAPGRRVHSEAVWNSVRDAYKAGEGGEAVAARHGIASATFWKHARAGKWLRRDDPGEPPLAFDPECPALEADAQLDLVDRRLSWALEAGSAGETLRWMRIRERIEARDRRDREAEQREAAAAERDRLAILHEDRRQARMDMRDVCAATKDIELAAKAALRSAEIEERMARRRPVAEGESGESKKSQPAANGFKDPDAPDLTRAERRRRQKYLARHGPKG